MSHNIGGLEYETNVYNNLKKFGAELLCEAPTGGFNAHDVDLSLRLRGIDTDIEIKADCHAQMGGTSISYDPLSGQISTIKEIPNQDLILDSVRKITGHLDSLIEYLRKKDDYTSEGFTIRTTKDAWDQAKSDGMLLPINLKVRQDTSFIHNHYTSKGINYIQMGGAGLFYLKDNPLDLPIPQLLGDIDIEIRAGRSGSKKIAYGNREFKACSGGIRVQGRLKFEEKSPISLDNDSVLTILS